MAFLPPLPRKYKAVFPVGAALLALLIVGAIYGERGVIDLQSLQSEQRRLEQAAFHLQQSNARLREHITRLRSDDRYLERWARHRFHLAKEGEIIFRFEEPEEDHPSPKTVREDQTGGPG
jgi:cell division protein FtsB